MKPREDAFGAGLSEQHRGEDTAYVIERDDGYVDLDGMAHYFDRPPKWTPAERRSLREVRGRVLDIGAGAGRIALELQRRGHRVTTIDNSPLAVRACRLRGVKDAQVVPIEKVSRLKGLYDTVVMYGNNFGLLGGMRSGQQRLRALARITGPDGRIAAQTMDPYTTDRPEHLAYHRRNRRRGRLGGQIRMRLRFRGLCTPWFDYLFVSRKELTELLKGSGWRLVRTIDGSGPGYFVVLEKERGPAGGHGALRSAR
jgi:SAM-dependent methyltransferase